MSEQLKPCPFCGEAPGDVGYVFCMSKHDCPAVQIATTAEQWNRRAPSPDLAAENERLRRLERHVLDIIAKAPKAEDFDIGGRYDYDSSCGNSGDVEAKARAEEHFAIAGGLRAALEPRP